MTFRLTGSGGPILDAATVVVLRDGASGLECLMLRKTRGQTFGGLWVFPGGRVEADVDGVGEPGARQAALRELAEETGLLLDDPDELVPFSHWSPPPEAPKRYATWFFLLPLPAHAPDVVIDGGEIGEHLWTTPSNALIAHAREEIELLPPTWITLQRLTVHAAVDTAVVAAREDPVETFATRIANEDGVPVAIWAPDAAYPAEEDAPLGDLAAPGSRHRLYMTTGGWRYERQYPDTPA